MTDLFGEQPATQPPDAKPAGEKRERGAYYTDDRLARAICTTLRGYMGGGIEAIFEPGCGGGAFLRAANATWPRSSLFGVDLVLACTGPGVVAQRDLFDVKGQPGGAPFDLCLGNPDFSIAERVVRHCMTIVARPPWGHVAMLLRLSFLESAERVAFFNEFPLRMLQPIAQRQSFTGEGQSDKVGLALYVWTNGFKGRGEILPPLVWR